MSTDTASETTLSERRLTANRANAQLSTGPRTEEGKAKSSLNAVKTGLTGRIILLADKEEAAAYRAHVARLLHYWQPQDTREHALVQSLADTQWRLDPIPGLKSALYALARERGADLFSHEDPLTRRLLLDAQTEVAEAKALKNLRLHEQRLRRQYQEDERELIKLRKMRWAEEEEKRQEKAQRRQEEAEEQRRNEQARKRAERKKARETAAKADGFEFTTMDNSKSEHPAAPPSEERSGSTPVQ